MKPWLFVGAKVVCVHLANEEWAGDVPIAGAVYTVESINTVDPCIIPGWELAVALVELPARTNGNRHRWPSICFRPLIDTTKTVEALKKLARDAMQTRRVDA